ncbi:MAG: hypothetical protein A2504_17100 [Bdellovibrionales bacterium RIFOXYD12_FULL_39_22]|nr:MAG: hypothetical protein A2385_10860 [Bdellovibrionales bacterium RIFOXYB1_FULL_39_21]OFZ40725.1 MAG: hypothetical protein A2485_16870 [Bdellovibrionales bacterium RIFOXYC12_FULL_39_17]OFZ48147.1 MAG: hypothetical protein A2404_17030 [Bdellovibrionales bacterium RIFOXYC1_FULL_39_130]OFZ75797.1 MAG: hypothetical protein A2560_13530 [Bdellovibrionales bacterium RIFOXYD1_FULL_39_84]OFZ91858.1 MAG: hypothetical protein A2504_17100 [Bdellovibrionales bacterium RIFOXYD12_FULL_39_22]HLE11366.1 Hy
MCLAIPLKVIDIPSEGMAQVETDGVTIEVSSILTPDIKKGEYVLVHAGFIIEKLATKEANSRLELFKEIYERKN